MVCTLRRPQKSKGGTPPDGRGVPREAGTKYNIKYNIKYSDDVQDTKRGVATESARLAAPH